LSRTDVHEGLPSFLEKGSMPYGLQNKLYLKKDSFTLRMLNIRGLPSDTRDMSKSIIEMMTSEPSIIFQPDVKYASRPYTIPAVITWKTQILSS
jgi:hypothetical protein